MSTISANHDNPNAYELREIPMNKLEGQPFNPPSRSKKTATHLVALAASISDYGLFYPLLVRKLPRGKFEIIDGHRRYAALDLMKWGKAPCIVLGTKSTVVEVFIDVNNKRSNYEGVQSIESHLAGGPVPSDSHRRAITQIEKQHGRAMLIKMLKRGWGPGVFTNARGLAAAFNKEQPDDKKLSQKEIIKLTETIMAWYDNPGKAKDAEVARRAGISATDMVRRIRKKQLIKLKAVDFELDDVVARKTRKAA